MMIIEGQVSDPQDEPVAGAAIYFVSAPVSMPDTAQITNTDGRFSMAVPVDGRYVIGIRSDTWGIIEIAVEVNNKSVFAKAKFDKKDEQK